MISILIPCYNGEQYIRRCVDSCLNQTYKNIKIIVVNDGSVDNSEQILIEYANKYSNVKYFNQPNQGLAQTRNILMSKVTTEFFYFLDVDDWLEQDAMETYIRNSKNVDMVINSSYIDTNKKTKPFYITNKINHKTTKNSYLIENTPFAWGILFRTQYIKDMNYSFNGKYYFFEDAGVITYWIYHCSKINFLNDPKYHYWMNKKSLSHNKMSRNKIDMAINQLNNLYSLFQNEKYHKHWDRPINDQFAFYHCIIFAYIQFQSNLNRKEKKYYKHQLKKLEKNNLHLKFPKRYWKFWYFLCYRLFLY